MSTTLVERERVEVVAPREVTEADVLERAADLLEEFGWCQGKAGCKEAGEFCALGAVMEASRDLGNNDGRVGLGAVLSFGFPTTEALLFPLAVWNDERGRTKAEVVTALRNAAEKARQ